MNESVHVKKVQKVVESIEDRIEALESDDRYPEGPDDNAKIQINAPLALVQQDMQSEVKGLKYARAQLADLT